MDRIDAMKIFVTAVDEGSLVGAARRLKRSPTGVSRALSFLEARFSQIWASPSAVSKMSPVLPARSSMHAAEWQAGTELPDIS
jgi:Bacterial regulatory helix-turn-helix protein, lysR family